MVNRETGEATFEAGGKTYTLVMDMNAMTKVEAHFSTREHFVPLPEILDIMNRGSVTHIRVFIWAALQQFHPDITLDGIGYLVQQAGGLEVFTETLAGLVASMRADPQDLQALGVAKPPERPQVGPSKLRRSTGGPSTSKRAS